MAKTSSMQERFGGKKAAGAVGGAEKEADNMTSVDSLVESVVDALTPAGVRPKDIVWFNVMFLAVVHVGALYGLAQMFTASGGYTLMALALGVLWPISGLGITVGVHRLWSHKAFKAHWTVRTVLALVNSMAYQGSIFEWSRDHRVHHAKSETAGDPYDASESLFFSHMGWVMLRKRPEVIAAGKKIPMDDLMADPIVELQHKYYLPSVVALCYVVPTLIGWYATGNAWAAFWIMGVFRHVFVLHCTWCVNSLAHALEHGYRPYMDIHPAENLLVTIIALGEGWHNFHHAFPTDYRAAEGLWWQYNPSTLIIDLLALVGLVWDRRSTSPRLVAKHKQRTLERRQAGISVLKAD